MYFDGSKRTYYKNFLIYHGSSHDSIQHECQIGPGLDCAMLPKHRNVQGIYSAFIITAENLNLQLANDTHNLVK